MAVDDPSPRVVDTGAEDDISVAGDLDCVFVDRKYEVSWETRFFAVFLHDELPSDVMMLCIILAHANHTVPAPVLVDRMSNVARTVDQDHFKPVEEWGDVQEVLLWEVWAP